MIIKSEQAKGECDVCHSGVSTHGALNQGATGRWCEVLWLCKSCAVQWAGGEENILPTEEGRERCSKNGYPDF